MAAATKAELRARTRREADMVRSRFLSDADVDQFVLDAYKKLYNLVVGTGIDYFMSGPTALTQTADRLALPDDFYKLAALDRDQGGGDWVQLETFQFAERNRAGVTSSSDVAGSYRLWYYPMLEPLEDDGDQIVASLEAWEEFIVQDAAARCLGAEESDPSQQLAARNGLAQQIAALAPSRDLALTDRITDIYALAYDSIKYRLVGDEIMLLKFRERRY